MKPLDSSASAAFLERLIPTGRVPQSEQARGDGAKSSARESFGAPVDFTELRQRTAACERSVVQLFALIAQHCPEVLPGVWAALYDVIAAEERLWVYPTMTVGEYEDGVEPTAPYLSRPRLLREWPHLVEHAHRVHAARETAERYRLTA